MCKAACGPHERPNNECTTLERRTAEFIVLLCVVETPFCLPSCNCVFVSLAPFLHWLCVLYGRTRLQMEKVKNQKYAEEHIVATCCCGLNWRGRSCLIEPDLDRHVIKTAPGWRPPPFCFFFFLRSLHFLCSCLPPASLSLARSIVMPPAEEGGRSVGRARHTLRFFH